MSSVPHYSRCLEKREILTVSEFDLIARFHETIPMVNPVSSSEIKKFISDFDQNYHFTIFSKNSDFSRFHKICYRSKVKLFVKRTHEMSDHTQAHLYVTQINSTKFHFIRTIELIIC